MRTPNGRSLRVEDLSAEIAPQGYFLALRAQGATALRASQ